MIHDTKFSNYTLNCLKRSKERKHVTSRIVNKKISRAYWQLSNALRNGEISRYKYLNYRAITLFGATSGQRPHATIVRLTIGHFKAALNRDKPLLDIPPECEKIRMQHYCRYIAGFRSDNPLLDGRDGNEYIFEQLLFERWLRLNKIPLLNGDKWSLIGDLRKWCEQEGDILQRDQSNKKLHLYPQRKRRRMAIL